MSLATEIWCSCKMLDSLNLSCCTKLHLSLKTTTPLQDARLSQPLLLPPHYISLSRPPPSPLIELSYFFLTHGFFCILASIQFILHIFVNFCIFYQVTDFLLVYLVWLVPKGKKKSTLWVNQCQLDEILFILDDLLGGMLSLEILSPVAVDQPDVLGHGEGM